jgi:hypothetical protein
VSFSSSLCGRADVDLNRFEGGRNEKHPPTIYHQKTKEQKRNVSEKRC